MTAWTDEELGRIGEAPELQLASERPDGTLRPNVTMWVVRVDDQLYVRSAYGPDNPWFRRAKASGVGRIRRWPGAVRHVRRARSRRPRRHRRRLPREVRPVRARDRRDRRGTPSPRGDDHARAPSEELGMVDQRTEREPSVQKDQPAKACESR